ncbi:Phosphatidylinositol 4-kinase alpha [Geodia barretti]|uniref:Phosphatidylinositol 4-kinase alpha n=2 Tax=Geodia barretti TaxID=519541 RepID=A0AA35THS6_GEOBA|nr:Phosphatidylinositol 4-kinase alpha [Geodia barretti]
MSWFGNIRTFHASALNLLAGSLAKCPDLPWEKVQRLVAHCPPLPDSSSSSVVLHDRGLSGVVALGLFAVESELAHHGVKVLHYLLQLLESLPRASWVQNTLASAKREGVIVEQFCYKLGLILSQIAATNPSHSSKIVKALLDVLQWFCDQFIKSLSTTPEEVCYETVPAILGLARAMKGTAECRAKAFREICGLEGEPEGGGGEEISFTFDTGDIIKLKNMVLRVTGSQQLKHLTSTAEGLHEGAGQGAGLPYRSSLSQVLHCSLVTLLRDIVTSCTLPLDPGFYHQLVKVCELEMEGGVRELGSSASASSNERAFHVICILSAATDMLVWASRNDTEIDSTFHRLSSLLTVHTSRFNVLVSPLRATILEGISSLAVRSQTLIPAALNTYKDLLYSSLLARMYSDAVASGNMESVLTARPTSFQMLTSYRLTSVHVSRADAFACVQWTLGQVVYSTLQAACEGGREVMDGFLASLGNKLYTTDANDNFALRTAECIVMVLGHVASHMGSKFNVVATVTGMFGQRLFHPTSSLDGKLVGELARIAAHTADPETMEEVVRLMSLSLGESSPNKEKKYGHIYQPMMDSLTFLARYLGDGEQRRELLLKTLQQFIQQGIMAKKASDSTQSTHKATSSSFSLGLLLPIIAGLAERVEPFTDPPKKVIVIFRDFWLYCVVMGFSESAGVFPAGWYRSVQAVARKSPLLLSMGAGQFLDKELELNRPLRIESIGQGDVQEARQSLLDGLDRSLELDRLVVRLSFSQCLYLISIHRLETLRLETSTKNFPLVFNYLEDKGLQGELWVAIEKIAHKLFDQYIEQMQAKTATEESAAELESLTELLVFKFNHIRGRIKQLADKFISKVVDKFSHLLWSRRVVYTMLDLLHQLSLSLHTMDPDRRRSLVVTLPDLPHSVTVPENATKREKTVSYFAQRVEQILELAMRWSPRETTSILLEYVRSVASSAHHSGVSLATAQINNYFDLNPHNKHVPPVVSESRPSCVKDHLSLLSSSLHRRTHHSGEVAGMMTAASIMAGVSPGNEGREKQETWLNLQLYLPRNSEMLSGMGLTTSW